MSERYKLNKEDGGKILKAIVYSGISAILTTALVILPQIELPAMYAPIVFPIINALLVAGKKFFETRT